jgi:hypothetical protein
MIAALGLSLQLARAPTDISVWIIISTMVWVAVAVLTHLNSRLRADAHTDPLCPGPATLAADVMHSVSSRCMTQPAHISRPALPAASLRAAQSWWACR